ncbi:hypothetical protein PT015_00265 [Candidatus Mycobacterium wuenschmannii]|uniref:Uncharacterized protein n=1 Tax=Candidatus Mycobacterium wuenschmannii TaxID=3027808 RepID=A0ABY8VWY5_9MYCO|nr:hypothetical protein [Candidatus Mycobacterium wuenschmannii]WIM88007.1 hypothetical protein PT015_00265 [Candidatus Mycobacterium wuenschmannii]
MEGRDARLSYDDLVHVFKVALNRVLAGGIMPPITVLADARLTLALLGVCHAVRNGRPTPYPVSRACAAFAEFAAQHDKHQRSVDSRRLRAVR